MKITSNTNNYIVKKISKLYKYKKFEKRCSFCGKILKKEEEKNLVCKNCTFDDLV